jgi:hypothetical protein
MSCKAHDRLVLRPAINHFRQSKFFDSWLLRRFAMLTCLIVTPRDIRNHVAGIVVDDIERAILHAQPESQRTMRKIVMSQRRAAANEVMMPTLWLSICGVMLRDPEYGIYNAATSNAQREYGDAVSEACLCHYSEKPAETLRLLDRVQMNAIQSDSLDNVGTCVWEIAHSIRVALYFAARCEVGEVDPAGTVCVFPIMSDLGRLPLQLAGPIDLLARLASAAVVNAMRVTGELAGWIALESDAVDIVERFNRQDGGRKYVANSLYKQFVRLLSRY